LRLAFKLDEHGRLLYPELLYSCPKKSGKTAFGAVGAPIRSRSSKLCCVIQTGEPFCVAARRSGTDPPRHVPGQIPRFERGPLARSRWQEVAGDSIIFPSHSFLLRFS